MRPALVPLTRREFVKTGLLAASAPFVSRLLSLPPAAPKRILIVGAGMAGLVAAYELAQTGHDVTILEAQLRPGGRVHTLRAPFSDGLYAEAGASRIPDTHDLTLRYARRFGLTLVPFAPATGDRVYALKGARFRLPPGGSLGLAQVPLDLSPEERRLGIFGLFEKYLGAALRAMGDPHAPDWPNATARGFDRVSMADYLREQGASRGAIDLLEMPFATADDDRVSFLWTLREFWHEGRETTRYKIAGGNDLLPRAFADRLKDRIRYGSPVVRIEQDALRVRAIVSQSGRPQTFEGDRLICTVPFPALRRVEVQPAFSEAKRRAIAELQYEPVTRVVLQCRTRYWEKDGRNGFGISDLPQEIFHLTHDQPGPRGLLVSYMFEAVGERAGAMSESERVEFALREMEKVHPGVRDHFEGAVSTVWSGDPWAGGAGTIHAPGQLTGIAVGIEQPEGRVHFAGEHTSSWPYWIQGALQSGLRAAREVSET